VKRKVFWKIYGVLVVLGIVLSVTLFVVFWNFLTAYEKSQPKHEMENVINLFEAGDSAQIVKYMTYNLTTFENDDTIIKYLDSLLMDGQWTFEQKTGAYSKNTPVYKVKKDGVAVATVTLLKSSDKAEFKMDKWELQSIGDILSTPDDYVITAPTGSAIYVNGIALPNQYITEKNIAIPDLAPTSKYTSVPTMVRYRVAGLYQKPQILAVGVVLNTELVATYENEHTLRFAFESNQEFNASQENRIIEITQIYGRYVINDAKFASLSPYIVANSDSYKFLNTISSINIWYGNHSLPEFVNLIVNNYQIYTTNCYSCDISFTLTFILANKTFQYPTNLRYYFVKSGDVWRIADFVIK